MQVATLSAKSQSGKLTLPAQHLHDKGIAYGRRSLARRLGGCAPVKEAGVAPLGTSRIQSSSRALSHSRSAVR